MQEPPVLGDEVPRIDMLTDVPLKRFRELHHGEKEGTSFVTDKTRYGRAADTGIFSQALYSMKGVAINVSHQIGNPIDSRSEDLLMVGIHTAIASRRKKVEQAFCARWE
jgi:hypothetical protein